MSGPAKQAEALGELRARFDTALAMFLERQGGCWPAGVPRVLMEQARRLVLAGGKRLRPLFCYWSWRGLGGSDCRAIVVAAAALEMFHTFALIHDDIMDGSDRRRGEPSVHRFFADLHARSSWRGDPGQYGRGAALLCGDLCAGWADEMLLGSGLPPEQVRRGYAVFAAMRAEVIAGQYLDLLSGVNSGSVADALSVVRLKAARYTVTRPLQVGAALAGAGEVVSNALAAFGDPLGDAFQLRDDVLGVFGDPAVTGKSVLDDLREGKPTVLVGLARERAGGWRAARFGELFGRPDLDMAGAGELREIIAGTGAVESVEEMIRARTEEALAALGDIPMTDEARSVLTALAGRAVDRRG